MIVCNECMKEIEEERIKYDEFGRIEKYPALCNKCSIKSGWK